jgi:serralysin
MAVINGTPGKDRLFGTSDADSISGGKGDDLIYPLTGVGDYVDGGEGFDTVVVDYSNLTTSSNFTIDRIEFVIATGGSGNDNFTFNNTKDFLFGGDGNDTLDTGTLDDTLRGGNGDDWLLGGDGNDSLSGENGNDYIIGSKGNNTLLGGDGNDVLATDDGNDYMDGGNNDDTLNGYLGQDFLVGGFGNDELIGNWGYDTLTGGAGADRFIFSSDEILNGADTITDANFAGEGDKIVANFGGLASINQFFYNSGVLSFDANLFDTVVPVVFAWVNVDSGFNFGRDFILL